MDANGITRSLRWFQALLIDLAVVFGGMGALFLDGGSVPVGIGLVAAGVACIGTIFLWRARAPVARVATGLFAAVSLPVMLLWMIGALPLHSWNDEGPPLSDLEEAARWGATLLIVANGFLVLALMERLRRFDVETWLRVEVTES